MIVKDTWGHYLESSFKENYNRIALIDISHNARYTYRDLEKQVESLERAFIGYGVEKGMHVALVFPSSAIWITSFLALIHIGAIPVCLNQDCTDEEIKRNIMHSDSKLVMTDEEIYTKISLHENEMDIEQIVITDRNGECLEGLHSSMTTFLRYGKEVDKETLEAAHKEVNYDDILAIQYTSGTTGMPKAVMSVHYKVLSNVLLFRDTFKYTKNDKILSSLPMYHMMGCYFTCLLTFATGGSLVLMNRFKTSGAIQALIEEECTSFHSVPTMFKLIMNKMGDSKFTKLDKGMIAGSYCEPEAIEEIREKMGISYVFPAYGQSEGNGYTQIRTEDPIEKVLTTVGRPIPGVDIKIVDNDLNEVPHQTEGEILVKTDYAMAGYYKDSEATQKLIVDGWIHTGDLGKIDEEGYVVITGRKKDIIVRGGENISPVDIEATLKEMKEIKDVVVVGVPDKIMGQEIGACIIIEEEAKKLEKEQLKERMSAYISKHLARYKRPKYIEIVDKFPLTGSGKVQKNKLVENVFG